MSRKKNKRGRYCMGCEDYRPNESFTAKGRKKGLCKQCQKFYAEIDNEFESDETFSFIAGYTDSGVPYGITHEEWEEIEREEKRRLNEVKFIVPEQMEELLLSIFINQTKEQVLHSALAMTLFLTNKISLERAAFLSNLTFTEYLSLLQSHHISWENQLDDGYLSYKKSLPDLLEFVDRMVEE